MWYGLRYVVIFAAVAAAPATGAQKKPQTAAQKKAAAEKDKPPAKKVSPAQLRAEWKVGDLKLTREAVEDAKYPANIKSSAIKACDWFLQKQEGLIDQVAENPAEEAKVRKNRATLEAQFNQKMAMINDDPQLRAELVRRLKALDREMDELADSAESVFARLDAAGVSPQQKKEIEPVVREANAKLKAVKAKAGSTKAAAVREEAVEKYRAARKQIHAKLTKEQREKADKKLEE
jgi:hypothetical protein